MNKEPRDLREAWAAYREARSVLRASEAALSSTSRLDALNDDFRKRGEDLALLIERRAIAHTDGA